jgi:hypothetical protein
VEVSPEAQERRCIEALFARAITGIGDFALFCRGVVARDGIKAPATREGRKDGGAREAKKSRACCFGTLESAARAGCATTRACRCNCLIANGAKGYFWDEGRGLLLWFFWVTVGYEFRIFQKKRNQAPEQAGNGGVGGHKMIEGTVVNTCVGILALNFSLVASLGDFSVFKSRSRRCKKSGIVPKCQRKWENGLETHSRHLSDHSCMRARDVCGCDWLGNDPVRCAHMQGLQQKQTMTLRSSLIYFSALL